LFLAQFEQRLLELNKGCLSASLNEGWTS
jgi:hypothetical protein